MKRKPTLCELALWAALPMAHTTRMEARLRMILDADRPRRAVTRRVLMAALGIGAAVLIPLAMLRPAAHAQAAPRAAGVLAKAIGFRRYISPPLPDGTRYTFLYPSYLGKIRQGWLDGNNQFDCVRIDTLGSKPVPWAPVRGGKVFSYRLHGKGGTSWPAPHEEFCSVVVGNAGLSWLGASALRGGHQWIGQNGSHHDFSLTDARTHLRFLMIHEDRYTPALFKQTDPVISGSFRILRPETAGASAAGTPVVHRRKA